jgi:hypothetical protein
MDFSISFRPPFRFGEMLSALCGGDTLFPLGEEVLTIPGEEASFKISGISSATTLSATFEILRE